ncbi:MAG TPA: hypothetical protein EYG94_07510 [Campylobacterales bacterium]|nr:hypothetical protein [Campylobacterales bacterium]
MINNTLKFIVLLFVYLIGLTFSLILIYASPDNTAHTFEASLFFLSTSMVFTSLYYNLSFKEEINSFMKYLYIILAIQFLFHAILLALISTYAHPMEGVVDLSAMYVFTFSGVLIFIGLMGMILKNRGVTNEK